MSHKTIRIIGGAADDGFCVVGGGGTVEDEAEYRTVAVVAGEATVEQDSS